MHLSGLGSERTKLLACRQNGLPSKYKVQEGNNPAPGFSKGKSKGCCSVMFNLAQTLPHNTSPRVFPKKRGPCLLKKTKTTTTKRWSVITMSVKPTVKHKYRNGWVVQNGVGQSTEGTPFKADDYQAALCYSFATIFKFPC